MRALWILLLLCLAPAAWGAPRVVNDHAVVELIAESARPAPGRPVTLGIRITPNPDWHSYWINPGEAGAENRYAWTLPTGARAGTVRYPTPEPLLVEGIMNHVYSHPATLLVDVDVPAGPPGQALPVALRLDYLICSPTLCVPARADVSIDLATGDGAADPAQESAFAAARAALPVPAQATFARAGGKLMVSAPGLADFRTAHFFALSEDAVVSSAPQDARAEGGALRLETAVAPGKPPARIGGVLRIERADGTVKGYAIEGPVGAGIAAAPASASARIEGGEPLSFPVALGLALAGGLLLNVMPCVFPILSLKALSLARGGKAASAARAEGRAYTGGVMLTCLALGGIILGLRAAGASAGWAFQLQDPRVIVVLLLLMTAIALNLAGLFEINLGVEGAGDSLTRREGAGGAFWTGVLAAFVATPCSGPFMGVALGAALVLPPVQGLAVFAGLGLGLALPFLALGYIPALRRMLPKPGAWMGRLRQILSIPMFLTALGLAWVLGRQAGVAGMTLGLAGALVLGLALWWLGARQRGGGRAWEPLAFGLAASAVAALAVVPAAPVAAGQMEGPLQARPFSEGALAAARAAHRPAFVYFTADWCITCKVNERGALADAGVAKAFARAGVVTLVGDWTRNDPAITKFLAANGRSGVPFYLFYHADGRVEMLPQLLTPGRLTGLV